MYIGSYNNYFHNLLVKEISNDTFLEMLEVIMMRDPPIVFRIKPDMTIQYHFNKELDTHITTFWPYTRDTFKLDYLEEKYGTIIQVTISKENRNKITTFLDWIDTNVDYGFFTKFEISSFLPYIFLNAEPNDSILSIGKNFPNICEIISDILLGGNFFINETDEKKGKDNYLFSHNNYCVLSYPITEFPFIQEFDKVLIISPSTEDGTIPKELKENEKFTLNKAIENHQKQKEYLISSLEKVKLGGICVYSTFSLNPFENEAVINSVLKMPEYKNQFKIIDCSSMLSEIERGKGLKSWDLNYIPKDITDESLLESLSSNSVIESIENCMRFYPHQIKDCSVFITVIKRIGTIANKKYKPAQTANKLSIHFTNPPDELIQKIVNEYELKENFNEVKFIIKEQYRNKQIYHVSPDLFDVLNEYGFDKLQIRHVGCLAFSFLNQNYDFELIPSVTTLKTCFLEHGKRYIKIDMDDFSFLIKTQQIPIERIKTKNPFFFDLKQTGGVCIVLMDYGPLIGGYVDDNFLMTNEEEKTLKKLFITAKKVIVPESFHDNISFLNKRYEEIKIELSKLEIYKNLCKELDERMRTIENQINYKKYKIFKYLFEKYGENPVDIGLIKIRGNSYSDKEHKLLKNIIDSRWSDNYWLSEYTEDSYIEIIFNNLLVMVDQYRILVGNSNKNRYFTSWILKGITEDYQEVVLDRVYNSSDITSEHPEAKKKIENKSFLRSIKLIMIGKTELGNYGLCFRNIELKGYIKEN